MELLQLVAPLHGDSGQCKSCNAPPHCLGQRAVALRQYTASLRRRRAAPAMHCPAASGQRAVHPLQCLATPPWCRGQWISCNTLPHCLRGSGQWNSCNTLPHCLGAVGSATPTMHCLTAWGQWALELLQRAASLPGGSGQCNSCNAPPHYLGAVGVGTPAIHRPTAWGALGNGTPATHRPTAWGQWAVQLLLYTTPLPKGQWAVELLQWPASLPGGNGQWNSCNALPHCLGAVGSEWWSERPVGHAGRQQSPRPGHTGLEGQGVLPRGWSEPLGGPTGRQQSPCPGNTSLGGGESCPGGGRSVL